MLYKYPPKPWVDRGWNHDIRDPILKGVLNIGGMGCARPCSSDYQNPKSTARHVDHRPFVARMHKSSLIKPPSCLPRGWCQVISDYLFSKSICSIERLKSARSLQILGPFLLRRAYKRPVLKPKAAPDPVSQTLAALKDGAAENWPCWRYTVSSMEANGIAWYSDDILPSKNLQYDSHRFTILGKSTPRRRLWTRSPWCLDPAWLLCYETFVVLTLFVKSFGEGFQDLSSIGFPICSFPEMGCLLGSQLTLICLGASRPPLGRPQYDSTVDIEVDRWRGASRCGFPGHPFDGWIGRPEEKMSKHAETRMRNQSYPIIMNGHGSDHQRRRTTLIFGIFWSRDVKGMKRVWAWYSSWCSDTSWLRRIPAMIPLGSWDELPIRPQCIAICSHLCWTNAVGLAWTYSWHDCNIGSDDWHNLPIFSCCNWKLLEIASWHEGNCFMIVTEVADQVLQLSMRGHSMLREFTAIAFARVSTVVRWVGCNQLFHIDHIVSFVYLDPNHQLDSSNIIKYPSDLESRLNLSLVIQIISLSPSRSPGWPCGRAWHHSWHIMPQQARLSCRFYDMIHGFLLYMDQYHRNLMERNFMFFVGTDISRWWKNKWKIMGNQRFNHHGSHHGRHRAHRRDPRSHGTFASSTATGAVALRGCESDLTGDDCSF